MLVYKVGGTVRDALLGRKAADQDHVVVGQTAEAMASMGYKQVGADFPVFIDPGTGAEYALARTERKKGKGHKGFEVFFDPKVTIEEDLLRRDFTINAMAQDQDGRIIDPYYGRRDISLRILRHVSEAFSEDPLRVLRAARLSAELGFSIAPETLVLMEEISSSGELEHLPPERIWQELSRGLRSERPAHMIRLLKACGALSRILPEVDALFGVPRVSETDDGLCVGNHTLSVLDLAARNWCGLDVRLAALLNQVGKALTPKDKLPDHTGHEDIGAGMVSEICERLRVPKKISRCAVTAARELGKVRDFATLDPGEAIDFLSRTDAFRSQGYLRCLLVLSGCFHAARPTVSDYGLHPNHKLVMRCLKAAMSANVSKAGSESNEPAVAVRNVRLKEVQKVMEVN